MNGSLDELIAAAHEASPELADEWEATALIESFGFTDRIAQQSFGFSSTHALGQAVYERLMASPQGTTSVERRTTGLWCRARAEAAILVRVLSSSLVYAIPWIAVFTFEYLRPEVMEIGAELAGPISVALMLSLITSGGFIQAIARKGEYYFGLKQPALARRICRILWVSGFAVAILGAAAALLAGMYFHVFDRGPLIVGILYYVALSVLWMTCALVSLQQHQWRIPLIFLAAGLAFALAKAAAGWSTFAAQNLAVAVALVAVGAFALFVFERRPSVHDCPADEPALPQVPVLVYSLGPYFLYGAGYFSFLFADRIAAGSAVPIMTGLQFALHPGYKAAMDLALLAFLLVAAFVEYCNFKFMHFWHDEARYSPPSEFARLTSRLRRMRMRFAATIGGLFLVLALIEWIVLQRLAPDLLGRTGLWVFALGMGGYCLFSLALFDGLMLFSLNQPRRVLRALAPALLINLAFGYTLSHALAVPYAAVGLVLGSILFAIDARRGVSEVFRHSEYAYYAAA